MGIGRIFIDAGVSERDLKEITSIIVDAYSRGPELDKEELALYRMLAFPNAVKDVRSAIEDMKGEDVKHSRHFLLMLKIVTSACLNLKTFVDNVKIKNEREDGDEQLH